jgi:hypothetical protein
VANNPLSQLTFLARGQLRDFDIRNTRLRSLDLRLLTREPMVDARGTKIIIRVDDPKQTRLDWQTTIDAGVTLTK